MYSDDDNQKTLTPAEASSQDSDGQNPIESGSVKVMVMMGLCDKDQERLGRDPFEYPDPEIKALCALWHEGYKRAQAGVPLFKQLFERVLTQNDRMILGLDEK
jgi:hypothetical protein